MSFRMKFQSNERTLTDEEVDIVINKVVVKLKNKFNAIQRQELLMDSNVVRVNILGQEYVMKTSANPKYIQEVAKYVNEKMDEIKDSGVDSSSQQLKIAVLACMNITAELFDIKSKSPRNKNSNDKKFRKQFTQNYVLPQYVY